MRPGEKVKQSKKKRVLFLQPFWSVNFQDIQRVVQEFCAAKKP